jgi:pimeloyl-ACP methyl ester carboxylesterase
VSASILASKDGVNLAYHHHPGRAPAVVFLGGFRSAMSGNKAMFLEHWCGQRGQAYVRMDYRGHGESSGEFEAACVSDWVADVEAVLAHICEQELLLVGSSMGGWIATLIARAWAQDHERPAIQGLIGMAAAPDFTRRGLWQRLDARARAEIATNGVTYVPSDYDDGPYPITAKLIDDGAHNLVLDSPLVLPMPVRLLHGANDADVPWSHSQVLLEHMDSEDASLTIVKGADHRLSEDAHLRLLARTVAELSGF